MNEQNSNTSENYPFFLPDWADRLAASDLDIEEQYGFAVTIRWYLSFLKRNQLQATYTSAKQFLKQVKQEKEPVEAIYEKWRGALRWFFLEAKSAHRNNAFDYMEEPVLVWEQQLVRKLRVAKLAFKTEKTYRYWCRRCWKFWDQMNPVDFRERHLSEFLDDLAVKKKVGASTQRQALNALVFWFN